MNLIVYYPRKSAIFHESRGKP